MNLPLRDATSTTEQSGRRTVMTLQPQGNTTSRHLLPEHDIKSQSVLDAVPDLFAAMDEHSLLKHQYTTYARFHVEITLLVW